MALEQRPAGDVVGDPGGAPRFRPLAGSDVRLGPVQPLERGLDVDECAGRQHELELGSSGQELGPDDAAQLREQHAEPRVVVGRRLLAVDGDQQLVAVDPAEPVEHEVGEEQLALGPGQRVLDPPSVQPHDEPAAELDSRLARLCHRQQA